MNMILQKFTKLRKIDVVLLLYFLHYVDYPSNIAGKFKGTNVKLKSGFGNLKYGNKLSVICRKLAKDRIIIPYEQGSGKPTIHIKRVKGPKVYYHINLNIFSQIFSPNFFNSVYLKLLTSLIKEIGITSQNEKAWLVEITNYNKYDVLTLFSYLKKILSQISEYRKLTFRSNGKLLKYMIKEKKGKRLNVIEETLKNNRKNLIENSFLNSLDIEKAIKILCNRLDNKLGLKDLRIIEELINFLDDVISYIAYKERLNY